jgi:polyisoprenoid-binding protein YceI
MSTTTDTLRQVNGLDIPQAGAYAIDKSHSTVEFVGRHLMITKVRGRFADFDGSIVIADVPEESSTEVVIQAASIDTSDEKRDGHLRSADFFDVEQFPSLTFRSTCVEQAKRGSWKLNGELTVRGVTKPVSLDLDFEGATIDPWGGQRIAFTAVTDVDREDWGLTWNQALETGGVLVGKKVRIELNVQAVRQQ